MTVTKKCLVFGATLIAVGVAVPAVAKAAKEVVGVALAFTMIILPLMIIEGVLKK